MILNLEDIVYYYQENAECSKENALLQQENEMLREKVQDMNKDICKLNLAS